MSWRKSGKCCPDPCVTNPCTATTCPQVSSALITGNVWQVPACDGTAGVLFPCMTSALIGAYIYNPVYGAFLITAFNSTTNVVTVQNTCIEGNAAPGTSVPSGSSFIFTSILGSEQTTVSDTDSIDMTLTGFDISADVNISPDAGNIIELRGNGLFAEDSGGGGCLNE